MTRLILFVLCAVFGLAPIPGTGFVCGMMAGALALTAWIDHREGRRVWRNGR